MSYKNIEDRRAAYRRWAEKNPSKRREYNRLLWLAQKANPIPQACIVENCDSLGERHHDDYSKPEEITWICRYHHRRLKHAGSCRICGDKISSRGLCNKHYKAERRKIDPAYVIRINELKRIRVLKAKSLPSSLSQSE